MAPTGPAAYIVRIRARMYAFSWRVSYRVWVGQGDKILQHWATSQSLWPSCQTPVVGTCHSPAAWGQAASGLDLRTRPHWQCSLWYSERKQRSARMPCCIVAAFAIQPNLQPSLSAPLPAGVGATPDAGGRSCRDCGAPLDREHDAAAARARWVECRDWGQVAANWGRQGDCGAPLYRKQDMAAAQARWVKCRDCGVGLGSKPGPSARCAPRQGARRGSSPGRVER